MSNFTLTKKLYSLVAFMSYAGIPSVCSINEQGQKGFWSTSASRNPSETRVVH